MTIPVSIEASWQRFSREAIIAPAEMSSQEQAQIMELFRRCFFAGAACAVSVVVVHGEDLEAMEALNQELGEFVSENMREVQ